MQSDLLMVVISRVKTQTVFDKARTSVFLFPYILSVIASFFLISAVYKTHPRYGIRSCLVSVCISVIWTILFFADQKKIIEIREGGVNCPIWLSLIIAFFLGSFVIYAVWGSGYLTLAPYESINNGTQHIDTLFHSSLAESFKRSLFPSILLNDEEGYVYHTFSHLLMGSISSLLGIPAFIAYSFLYPVIFCPLYLCSQFIAVLSAKKFFVKKNDMAFVDLILVSVFSTGAAYAGLLGNYGVWKTSYIISESFLIANTIAFFSYSLHFYILCNFRKDERIIWLYCVLVIPLEIVILSWTKVSVGFLFMMSTAYYLIRARLIRFRNWLLNLFCILGIVFSVSFFVDSTNLLDSIVSIKYRWMAFDEYITGPLGILGHYIILLVYPVAYIVSELYSQKYCASDVDRSNTVFIEDILFISALAFCPALIMVISGGSAAYFSYFIEVPALILLCGHNYMDIHNEAKGTLRILLYVFLTIFCIWNAYTNRSIDPLNRITGVNTSNLSNVLLEVRESVGNKPEDYAIFLDADSLVTQVFKDGRRASYSCPAMTGVGVINATYIENEKSYTFLEEEVTSQYGVRKTDNNHNISLDEAMEKAGDMGKKTLIHFTSEGYDFIKLEQER